MKLKTFKIEETTWIIIPNALVATDIVAYDESNPEKLVGFNKDKNGNYIQVKSKK